MDLAEGYAKVFGWLSATPRGGKVPRYKSFPGVLERAWDQRAEPLLMDMQEVGWCQAGPHGPEVLHWSEIKAWMDATGRRESWLALAVRRLSAAFVDEFVQANEPARPMPEGLEVEEEDATERRQIVQQQLRQFAKNRS